ncbi:MAG: copper chaperone PCu(A)C [Chloroflexi bacterium]|nr:copper chaperone PCu(A)C [Chloroflexota bacterium]
MRVKTLLVATVALMLALAPVSVIAQEAETCELVYLFDGWARATVEGAPNSAAYGVLVNLGSEDDTLIAASTEAAEVLELHEMMMGEGDVMMMRPMEGGFPVSANGFTVLEPGGLHIMLINLTAPLVAGEELAITLTFENAGDVELVLPIREMPVEGMDMGGEGNMDMTQRDTAMGNMDDMEMMWPEACRGVHVVDPWVRPAGPGQPTSAAYGLLLNLTDVEDTLIAAATDAAETVELHEMTMGANDMMMMRPIEGGIAVSAGGLAVLKPGGLHVMMIGLTGELAAGAEIDFTLTFADFGEVELTVPVREPMAGGMDMGGHSMGGG